MALLSKSHHYATSLRPSHTPCRPFPGAAPRRYRGCLRSTDPPTPGGRVTSGLGDSLRDAADGDQVDLLLAGDACDLETVADHRPGIADAHRADVGRRRTVCARTHEARHPQLAVDDDGRTIGGERRAGRAGGQCPAERATDDGEAHGRVARDLGPAHGPRRERERPSPGPRQLAGQQRLDPRRRRRGRARLALRSLIVLHHAVVHPLRVALAPDDRELPVRIHALQLGRRALGLAALERLLDQRLLGSHLGSASDHQEGDNDDQAANVTSGHGGSSSVHHCPAWRAGPRQGDYSSPDERESGSRKDGAEGGTRTPTGCPTRPSNVRVCQFRHFGTA